MSSISSLEGSEKDSSSSIRQKNNISEGYNTRYASLRKTDLLDVLETTTRTRDTDTWSVAATIDDQESVISAQGIGSSNSGSGIGGNSGLVGLPSHSNTGIPHSANDEDEENLRRHLQDDNLSLGLPPMETLLDLDDRISTMTGDEDDKHSRSIAAEFGDDGTRSATADFDDSEDDDENTDDDDDESDRDNNNNNNDNNNKNKDDNNDNNKNKDDNEDNKKKKKNDHQDNNHRSHDNSILDKQHHHRRQRQRQHNVVNDFISAPPQPQPSFTPIVKSYMELLEENDILQSQIQSLRLTQKHQAQIIDNLRSLTECSKEDYEKAIHLSNIQASVVDNDNDDDQLNQVVEQLHNAKLSQDNLSFHETEPLINTATAIGRSSGAYIHDITDMLNSLADNINQFVQETVDEQWQLLLEKELFKAITEKYLITLPFGTDNQELLNTAYRDQLRRFQSTLGASFAKWYRRQTVQSLSLNPATKEYFEQMKGILTNQLADILDKHTMTKLDQPPIIDDVLWNNVLHWSRYLSLELHGGEADVVVQPIIEGTLYDQEIMKIIGQDRIVDNNNNDNYNRKVTFVASPLFIDEDDHVLLPAKVLLEDI